MPPVQPKKPITPPEDKSLIGRILPWVLILAGIGAIAAMIYFNPPEKKLNCRATPGGTGLTGFGSCSTD